MRKVFDPPARALAVLAATCLGVLMMLTVADVTRRNITGRALPGTVEYSELLMVALVFLGLAAAQRRKEHVAVNLLTSRLPVHVSRLVRIAGLVVVLLFIGWMTWKTGQEAHRSLSRNEVRIGLQSVQVWPARLAMPVGLAALFLQVVADVLDLTRRRPLGGTEIAEGLTLIRDGDADEPIGPSEHTS